MHLHKGDFPCAGAPLGVGVTAVASGEARMWGSRCPLWHSTPPGLRLSIPWTPDSGSQDQKISLTISATTLENSEVIP